MPELPEVEVVRRGIVEHVVGRTIEGAEILGHRVARRHPGGPADLASRLAGTRIVHADRRGKYLWLVVDLPSQDPSALVVHLGMSGQLRVLEPGAAWPRHTHARFCFTDTGPQLAFVDQRTFGGLSLLALVPDPHRHATPPGPSHPYGVPASVTHIASDPLEPTYDEPRLVRTLKTRHTEIKKVLLDQTVVSGIGNIYADEALWRAQVHGRRICSALSAPALVRVLGHARDVMTAALSVGGTSFDALYVNVNGASGFFDRSLDAYGQTGSPCPRCGTAIRREEFMNRSSHYCPRCQPRPRRKQPTTIAAR